MRKEWPEVLPISHDLVEITSRKDIEVEASKPDAPKTPQEVVMEAYKKGALESLKIKKEKLSSDSETEN